MKNLLIFVVAIALMTACQNSDPANSNPSSNTAQKRYGLEGKVISIDKAARKAKVEHEEIPGFMERMTMEFPIHDDSVLEKLQAGNEIRAVLVVDSSANDPYWLENIEITSSSATSESEPPHDSPDKNNDVPDFRLTNQDGKRFSLRDYKGKALAITFIYSRCPLPEYCIKMSRNFSDLAIQLNGDADLKNKIRLLSISFDPANDTPQKLRSYGQGYLGNPAKPDFTVWQLAVAPENKTREIAKFFGLRFKVDENDKNQFDHTLQTVVISPQGKILMTSDGSDWKPADLLEKLKETLK